MKDWVLWLICIVSFCLLVAVATFLISKKYEFCKSITEDVVNCVLWL